MANLKNGRSATAKKAAPTEKMINVPQALAFGGMGSTFARYVPTDHQLILEYNTNGIVFTCANLNAKGLMATQLRLYRQKSGAAVQKAAKGYPVSVEEQKRLKHGRRIAKSAVVEEVVEHPVLALIHDVNDNLNGGQLWFLTSVYLDVLGRAYWYIEREGDNYDAGVFRQVRQRHQLRIQRRRNIAEDSGCFGYRLQNSKPQ